jgi:hypothetical protein
MQSKSKIFNVGRFSITDKYSALKIVAAVEKKPKSIAAVFWVYLDAHSGGTSISIAMNIVEMRSFASALKLFFERGNFIYDKKSGGDTAFKTLSLENKDSTSVTLFMISGQDKLAITINQIELLGLAGEITFLCNKCSDACYTSQLFYEKKRVEKEKEEEK